MASKDIKDKVTTAVEFLEQQQTLEEEAGEILPWNFDQCTFSKGYLRQPVYACKTCKPDAGYGAGGVCYSCSIACHADHDLVELFNKRGFRCDCGTSRLGKHPCQVEPKETNETNEQNHYNHNFEGRFCWCDADYDPEKEESNMHQCCICEDWFHEDCVSGQRLGNQNFTIPELESFEEFICRACTSKFPFLKSYKHSHMFFSGQTKLESTRAIPAESGQSAIGKDSQEIKNDEKSAQSLSSITNKRKMEESDDDIGSSKKVKSDEVGGQCKRDNFPLISDNILVDIFCVEGWRDELCRCVKCMKLYKQYQIEFILQEEDTHEPPKDESAQTSIFDSGMKILTQMDRVTAIEGLIAYNKMRDEIREFLQPFAESGKTVTKQDIEEFVQAKLGERKLSNNENNFF
ncbi:hypothetical protein G9A89_023738 [Geosiphon pyriformis]|nr:hypothetical protein G9A89_023738 [Geosiphon pyriformis]